jgi:hypothetical protein
MLIICIRLNIQIFYFFVNQKFFLTFSKEIYIIGMMIRKQIYIFLPLLLMLASAIVLFAGAVIVDFRGEPGANKVTLHWATISEVNCKGFHIERSLDKTDFAKLGFVKGAGNSSERKEYEFVDNTIYKTTTSRTFYYRIKIIDVDNTESTFDQLVAITPSISGARYTWGSIKALFR